MPPIPASLRGAACALGGMGLYCLYDVTIKYLGTGYSAPQVLFCAGLFYVPMILGYMMWSGDMRQPWPVLPRLTAVRMAIVLVNGVLAAWAFTVLPLAQAYAVFFLMPLLISLLAVPMLGERMDIARGTAILAGFAGVIIALQPGRVPLNVAHLAAFAGAAMGALNYIVLRRSGGVESTGVLMVYPAAAQLAGVALAMPFLWVPMPAAHWGLAALMGVENFAGAMLMIMAYRLAPVIVVAPMQYSQIIWAAVFGALFFGERMVPHMVLGIVVIVAAGLFLLWHSGRRQPVAG